MLALLAAGLFVLGRVLWRALLALAVALLILIPALPRFNPIRWLSSAPPGDLRVLTFNTSTMNSDFDAIAKLIVRERADIVLLQQISDLTALKAQISRTPGHFGYFSFPEHTADMAILSRFPLLQSQTFGERVTSVATIGKCQIRLWDLHAPHGQFAIENQEQFFIAAAAALDDEKLALIVTGDLNSTEFNSAQAPLRAELRDAYAEAGSGFGSTFPSRVRRFGMLGPLFRIDHVFFRGLEPASAWVVSDNAGSDHLPVLVTFKFRPICG
jgi:vancomycin resistance protein VanJ